MNFSVVPNGNTTSNSNNNISSSQNIFYSISYHQLIGIIIAGIALLASVGIILCLIFYQKYRLKSKKLNNVGLTSNNPCYVGSSVTQFENPGAGQAHCNMSVSTDFYDIDDLTSLDNDSFLNSLENAIFVGYMSKKRPSITANDSFSRSVVHSNQQVPSAGGSSSRVSNSNGPSRHTYKRSSVPRSSSIKLRTGKGKRPGIDVVLPVSGGSGALDHGPGRTGRVHSDTISECIGSRSNLISSSSNMFLDESVDSVCDSCSKPCPQFLDTTLGSRCCDTNVDMKAADSSTDSHTSVNSSSAMIGTYRGGTDHTVSTRGALPDLINSTVPSMAATILKRTSSAYSTVMIPSCTPGGTPRSVDESVISGQILDPLRAGKNIHFINDIATRHGRHERHFSYNVAPSNSAALFEYDVPG